MWCITNVFLAHETSLIQLSNDDDQKQCDKTMWILCIYSRDVCCTQWEEVVSYVVL